jgi:hypothetical protein
VKHVLVLRWRHYVFLLEIFSMLEIRFSEPNGYKGKSTSASVRPLSSYVLPDIYISSSKQELVNWLQYFTPKTSNNANGCHTTLVNRISSPVCCLGKTYITLTENTVLKLW